MIRPLKASPMRPALSAAALKSCALLLGLATLARAEAPLVESTPNQAPVVVVAPDAEAFPRLPALLWTDTKQVFQRPSAWTSSDWNHLWLGAAGLVVAGVALDSPIDKAFQRSAKPSWTNAAKNVEFLGGTGSILIAGGAYLGGAALDNREVRSVGIDLGISMAIAQLTLTIPLKNLVGRDRPSKDQGAGHFQPLGGGQSFPSGHTTQAFVLASVISEHADQTWVTGLSYGLASLVGVARMEQRQHFLSDVLGGAIIGTYVGRTVTRYNQTQRDATSHVKVAFQPLLSSEYKGAVVRVSF